LEQRRRTRQLSSPSLMALSQKIGDMRFFAGLAEKKGTAAMLSPSSMVAQM